MKDLEDFWSGEHFEETVASALIACYESKPIKNRGAVPSDRMTEERLMALRNTGPYVPSNSRYIENTTSFDMVNDTLAERACFGFAVNEGDLIKQQYPDAYFVATYLKKVNALGKHWERRAGGQLYEMVNLVARAKGIGGERAFFSVTKDGQVVSCNVNIASVRGYVPGQPVKTFGHDADILKEREINASTALQFEADRRFCWTMTAKEANAKVHLGCMKEEIKSLLYARSLPMTATGRKRPVLHLVEAHKRRLKSGIDVNIDSFLRGVQEVEMDGTLFTIKPPAILRPVVSEKSEKYFEELT